MDRNSPPKVNSDSAVRGFFYLMAAWGIGTGIFFSYAGAIGADAFSFLGVGAYVWIGIAHLVVGLLALLGVHFRPRWFGLATR